MADLKLYANLKITRNNSEAEIEAEIPLPVLETFAAEVVQNAKKDFELPGFRKGQVPEELVRKHLNEMHVLEDAADMALREIYPQIVDEEKLDVITAPHVTLTRIALGNPVGFKARVGLVPQFKLPDYRKIGKEVVSRSHTPEVAEQEVADAIRNIQMMRMKAGGEKGGAGGEAEKKEDEKEAALPELTDEYVKSLGTFESVADFKEKIKAGIQEEKDAEERRRVREEIAEKLGNAAQIPLPPLLVEEEVAALRNHRYEEIQRMGGTMETYLKQIGKSEEDVKKEECAYVERQLKTKLLLEKIAEAEKLETDPKVVQSNLEYMMAQNSDLDPERAARYIGNMLTNEMVLELLEGKEKVRE